MNETEAREVFEMAADSGRIEVRIALLDWLGAHIWWHYGCAVGMAAGAIATLLSEGAAWSQVLFWAAWLTHKWRSDWERELLMRITRGQE